MATTFTRETEQEKAERKTRVEDAGCALQANAVDTAKDNNPNWREMNETDWMNAVHAAKLEGLLLTADQYRIDPDELRAELGLL